MSVLLPPKTAERFLIVWAMINSFALLIILIYHVYTTKKHLKTLNPCNPTSKLNKSIILTLPLFIFASCMAIIQPFPMYGIYCKWSAQYLGGPIYFLFKLMLYLILTSRVHEAFNGTMLGYSPNKLKIWAGFLILCNLFIIIAFELLTATYLDSNTFPKCAMIVNNMVIIAVVALDFIACTVNLYLFIRPLCQLHKLSDSKDDTFKSMAKKQCILSIIAILTSVLVHPSSGIFPQLISFLGLCDINISILCVIFSYDYLCILSILFGIWHARSFVSRFRLK